MVHLAVKLLHRPRVLTDEAWLKVLDAATDAKGGTVVGAFTVANQAFVRFHLDEGKSPPHRIAENRCYFGNFHPLILQNVKIMRCLLPELPAFLFQGTEQLVKGVTECLHAIHLQLLGNRIQVNADFFQVV